MSTLPDTNVTDLENKDILSKLAGNNHVLQFVSKLNLDDRVSFKNMMGWSPSIRANLINQTDILGFVNKLSDDDVLSFMEIRDWSRAFKANLSNAVDVVRFMNVCDPGELRSLVTILGWSPTLLDKLRLNPEHLSVLHRMWDHMGDRNRFIKTYFTMMDSPNAKFCNALDAFSNGQIDSKSWLIDELLKLKLPLGRVWTLCGWIGTLGYLMLAKKDVLGITNVRSFDIDPTCHFLADTLNRSSVVDGWLFKASTLDVNNMSYDDFIFETLKYDGSTQKVQDSADTIINTSVDHMGSSDKWFESIPTGKLVVLQNNDWFSNDQHDNSIDSVDSFEDRYPFSNLLFKGSLDCRLYNRFMLIGVK